MQPGPHRDLLEQAIAVEARGQRALLAGEAQRGAAAMAQAAELYGRSWELAPPASYGRLIGMLKAAVIAGEARERARFALTQLPDGERSAAAAYVAAIAALVLGDDALARDSAVQMRAGSAAFERAAAAIAALASEDVTAYDRAVAAIVADFESRQEHLTGVAIADTALMLERLAAARGMACAPASPLLPAGA